MYTTPAPTPNQRELAHATLERLRTAPDAPLELPSVLREMIETLLSETAQGHAVALLPLETELTTHQAADLMGVSRPTLIALLEAGQIPYHKVGTHRRVKLEDLQRFIEDTREKRRVVLAELVAEAQELGMGY